MSFVETIFWWRLSFSSLPDFEELFFWKLEDLGICRYAIQYLPENLNERTFFVWLPSCDWSISTKDSLLNSLMPLAHSNGISISQISWEKIADEDWSKSWKQYWTPDAVGRNLLILPAWLEIPEEFSQRTVLRLDPGMAFGTGSHPTTRLCLEALEDNPPVDLKIIDLGCGSGILSLAALILGAKEVWAVDIDSLAVCASLSNIRLNKTHLDRFSVERGSLDVLRGKLKRNSVDLLLCNILAHVIEKLALDFDEFLSPNGRALLSGILVDQLPRLENLFDSLGWEIVRCVEKDKWALLEVKKPKK